VNWGQHPEQSGSHERGEHKLRLSLGQIKRLKELLEQAGMSIDDLPDDID
jgi:hypothetical protein